jgi:hypothetical protein
MAKVTLVTASGDRPLSLSLVLSYMERQDFKGDIVWIIADDSREPYELPSRLGKIPIHHVYRGPCPKIEEGHISLSKNLIAALQVVQNFTESDMIAVIGDDDWYRGDYLQEMLYRLRGVHAAGHKWVKYGYPPKGIKQLKNVDHAGLESTVFTPDMIPHMIAANLETIKDLSKWADWRFWKRLDEDRVPRNLFKWELPHDYRMISLKGKGRKGRYGVGNLHDFTPKDEGLQDIIPKADIDLLMKRVYAS